MEVFRKYTFAAAHSLPEVGPDHKCRATHGHTFEVVLWVSGPVDEAAGWVQDFGDIDAAFQPLLARLDHGLLNEIDGLGNPTSENIARWIWRELKLRLRMLSKVVVQESESAGVVYQDGEE